MEDNKKTAVGSEILELFRANPETDVKAVCEKYGISKTWAYRLRKKAIAEVKEDSFLQDDNTRVPQELQDVVTEKEYWQRLYEDPEEGWTFQVKKGEVLSQIKSICYIFVFYPRNVFEYHDMCARLTALGWQWAHALHDKDYWLHDSPLVVDPETGIVIFEVGERWKRNDPKKLHAHGMVVFDSVQSKERVQKMLNQAFSGRVAMCQVGLSINGYFNYLIHDSPECRNQGKFPYPEEIRICENGFEPTFSKSEKNKVVASLTHYCLYEMYAEYHRYEYADLCEKFDGQAETIALIRGSYGHFSHLITSLRKGHLNFHKEETSDIEDMKEEYEKILAQINKELDRRNGV